MIINARPMMTTGWRIEKRIMDPILQSNPRFRF